MKSSLSGDDDGRDAAHDRIGGSDGEKVSSRDVRQCELEDEENECSAGDDVQRLGHIGDRLNLVTGALDGDLDEAANIVVMIDHENEGRMIQWWFAQGGALAMVARQRGDETTADREMLEAKRLWSEADDDLAELREADPRKVAGRSERP